MSWWKSPRVAAACGLLAAGLAGSAIASQRSASAMAAAANKFLEALTPEQRQSAVLPMNSEDFTRWHYVPTNQFPRKGVALKDMSATQRALALDLLKTGLSQSGYQTATAIMDLENILKEIEGRSGRGQNRDPDLYFFTIFGTPAPKGVWGWRVNGHHLALYFTVGGGVSIASTPTFLGTNPAEVREGAKQGLRIQAAEQDAGRALVMALDDKQRAAAIINTTAPNEIVTNNTLDIKPLSPDGLKASAMTAAQRDLLTKVIDAYAGLMAPDVAAQRMAKIKAAGFENIAFAWAGPVERGALHYYRVQGPTFLIEFDNTQNQGNHVHSIWRDFNGDFGRDLLREHLRTARHE